MTDIETSASLQPTTVGSSHPTLSEDIAAHEDSNTPSNEDSPLSETQDPSHPDQQEKNTRESLLLSSQDRFVILSDQELQEKHELDYKTLQLKQRQELIEALTDKSKASEAYHKNSKKEELALAYAANFNRQYGNLYPGRKELLLSPPNEFSTKVSLIAKKDNGIILKMIVNTCKIRNSFVRPYGPPNCPTKSCTTTDPAPDLSPITSAISL